MSKQNLWKSIIKRTYWSDQATFYLIWPRNVYNGIAEQNTLNILHDGNVMKILFRNSSVFLNEIHFLLSFPVENLPLPSRAIQIFAFFSFWTVVGGGVGVRINIPFLILDNLLFFFWCLVGNVCDVVRLVMCRRVMIRYWCCFDILSGSQPGSCRSTVEGRGGTSLSPQSLSGPPTQQPGQIRHNNFPNVKELGWTLFQLAIFWEVTNHYSQKFFLLIIEIFSVRKGQDNNASPSMSRPSPGLCHARRGQWEHRPHRSEGLPGREVCLHRLLPHGLCLRREHHALLQQIGRLRQT